MRKILRTSGMALAAALFLAAPVHAQQAQQMPNQQMMGRGMMGQGGMGPGYMMGPMMGQGYMMGNGMMPMMMTPGMMGNGMMMGPMMMGPGMMMAPGMMGNGMMGGMGPGMMGPGMMYFYRQQGDLNISADQVKTSLETMLTMMGNSHVKLGKVSEKDKDTITADIVTTDKEGLVQRYSIDRHNGVWTAE